MARHAGQRLEPDVALVAVAHSLALRVIAKNGSVGFCGVDRPPRWGNPFEIGRDGTTDEVIQKYRDWFLAGTEPRKIGRYIIDPRRLRDHIHELRGFNLACCRSGLPCHADFYSNKRTNLNPHCKVPQN
jgi:hypothetical protein